MLAGCQCVLLYPVPQVSVNHFSAPGPKTVLVYVARQHVAIHLDKDRTASAVKMRSTHVASAKDSQTPTTSAVVPNRAFESVYFPNHSRYLSRPGECVYGQWDCGRREAAHGQGGV